MSQHHSGRQSGSIGRWHGAWGLGSLVLAWGLALWSNVQGQQVHRNGFEVRTVAWSKGPADAACKETLHAITDQTAHTGQLCEYIQLTAEQGSYIHYHYPTGRAPLAEELIVRLWIKANRPGVQLAARLVLPRERHPQNLAEPLTALLRGDVYQLVGRWQALELRRPVKLAKEQQQLMRAEYKRDIDFTDAYIDRLVLNVYGGPGLTEVWIDDLEIGPVLDEAKPTGPLAVPTMPRPMTAPAGRHAVVELNQERLLVNGKRFFFRGIRHSNTPLNVLRDAGFNTLWLEPTAEPTVVEEATRLGFWLVPTLPADGNDTQPIATEVLGQTMSRFQQGDAVLFWDLGGGKTAEEATLVARTAQTLRALDGQRPLGGDVWDGFTPYSRHLDLLGAHRWPLLTAMELLQYRDWLLQRRLLARPGTFMWTWVQTHLPDWYVALVYNRSAQNDEGFAEPIGPQPEQIRLLSYIALAAGYRGLGFWSDRFLSDNYQGRDRLLQLALLNQEMQLLEPLLLSSLEAPTWIETSSRDVKAAVLRTEHGLLVLPMWLGKGSQFVPGQAAAAQLTLVVPQVPASTQAWEVTPGDVRSLRMERVTGGMKVTLPEFGLTTAIVFTSDHSANGLLVRFQDQTRKMRRSAARWMYDLAQVEIDKVLQVEDALERAGHTLPDAEGLRGDVQQRLQSAREFYSNGDYRQAYQEAQRALRPLRILMRAQWETAVKQLDTPTASPYAVSYFTLPRHWQLMDQVRQARIGANVLPDGAFETAPETTPVAWLPQEVTLDDVELSAWRVMEDPREGKRCLKLEVKPKNPQQPPSALERTFLAINSPAVKLTPGTLVRISGWVKIPKPITASADGALLYDSAGGEPLAVRLTAATPWKKFTLYRRVPESGSINVTVALTGIGTAYFDDLRIEPLLPAAVTAPRRPAP